METFLIKALQLILSLSLLVFVHELGHFMFAKLFKVRVDKFYLFFNVKFSLVRVKKINRKWQIRWFAKNAPEHLQTLTDADGQAVLDKKGKPVLVPAPLDELPDGDWRKYPETTEWGIGWLPLGGYCKIAGMIDESMDPRVMNSQPQPWEYRSRAAWQRLLIIVGGVLMNFLTAIVIYSLTLFAWGKEFLPLSEAYLGYNYCQTAKNAGFEDGDLIVEIAGEKVEKESSAVEKIVIEGKREIVVSRAGERVKLLLPEDFSEQLLEKNETRFMEICLPFVVENSVGQNANLLASDSLVAVAQTPTPTLDKVISALSEHKNERVQIDFFRAGELRQDTVVVDENGKIGVELRTPEKYFRFKSETFGFFAAFPAGWRLCLDTLGSYIKQFRLVFTKAGAKNLGGFGAIGNLFPALWDWQLFWAMTAFLSLILAFMNILPIPALDGGYVLFLLYEIITRRRPSDKFMEVVLTIGWMLLLALLIFANGNDILRIFK